MREYLNIENMIENCINLYYAMIWETATVTDSSCRNVYYRDKSENSGIHSFLQRSVHYIAILIIR